MKNNIDLEDTKIKFASDAGYNRGKNLSYIDREENIDAYISMFNRDEKTDIEKNEFLRDGKKNTQYGCELKNCVFCSKRNQCLTVKEDIRRGYRTIEDDGYVVYRKEMKDKMNQGSSKEIYSKRAGCIEPVFGQIKNNRGFTRFRLKGLPKVRTEFLIMAIAHNLGKIMRHVSSYKPLLCSNGG